MLRRLIPPPPRLISDKISQEKAAEAAKGDVLPGEPVEEEDKSKFSRRRKKAESEAEREESKAEEPEEEPPADADSGELQRVVAEAQEAVTSTSFSKLEEKSKTSFFGKIW